MMVDREALPKRLLQNRLLQNRLLPSGLMTNRQALREGFGWRILRFLFLFRFLLFLGVSAGFTAGRGVAEDAPPDSLVQTRPHVVIYYVDEHPGGVGWLAEANRATHYARLAAEGMTFTGAYAAAAESATEKEIFYRGSFPPLHAPVPRWPGGAASERLAGEGAPVDWTLTTHLKALGYRLALIGPEPKIGGNHFPLEAIATRQQWQEADQENRHEASGVDLAAWLAEVQGVDHRPLCLVIHDSFDDRVDERLGRACAMIRGELPEEQTLFVVTAGPHRGAPPVEAAPQDDDRRRSDPLRIPLLVQWSSQIDAGVESDALVSTVDLLPTIVELVGATPPNTHDGCSFAGVLRGEESEHRDLVFAIESVPAGSERTAWKSCSVRDRRFKFLCRWEGSVARSTLGVHEEFYDLIRDPDGRKDLLEQPAYRTRQQTYRDQLALWLQRRGARLDRFRVQ